MESHNNQKKIAAIHDMTGFGRCALTVVIPVISVMGIQCCPVPTSILSNHTAFSSCFFDDYTRNLDAYIAEWKKLGLTFSGIYSGFLASVRQIGIVREFIQYFADRDTRIIVDPVMADHGKLYKTYTPQMCEQMKELVSCATLITPNLTEACILTDLAYREDWQEDELEELAGRLLRLGPEQVVITGIPCRMPAEEPLEAVGGIAASEAVKSAKPGRSAESADPGSTGISTAAGDREAVGNFYMDVKGEGGLIKVPRIGRARCGTGDLFASILAADAVNGVVLGTSVRKAALFVAKVIQASEVMEIPVTDGVCFEEYLKELT